MKKQTSMAMVLLLTTILTAEPVAYACTNLIITKGASSTGSVTICYTCDASFASKLAWLAGGDHKPGIFVTYAEMRVRGVQIKQAPHTYAVLASNGIGGICWY